MLAPRRALPVQSEPRPAAACVRVEAPMAVAVGQLMTRRGAAALLAAPDAAASMRHGVEFYSFCPMGVRGAAGVGRGALAASFSFSLASIRKLRGAHNSSGQSDECGAKS